MTQNKLPANFTFHPATWADLDAVAEMIYATCAADGDATMAISRKELAQEWNKAGFNLAEDTWVVKNDSGKLIGYEEFYNRFAHASLQGDGYVHPEYNGLGVGSSLLAALDKRARKEIPLAAPGLRVFIRNGFGINEKNAAAIHEEAGFKPIRYSWRMEIKLDTVPSPAALKAPIELRTFDLAKHDHAVYLAHEEAFRDHWGHTPDNYEFWQRNKSGHPDFDAQLWYVAWDDDQIAGYSICRERQGIGWVGSLGVRRPWRKQGLGMALLQHSFIQLYQRGFTTIGLAVDASNPTGATRLYERAGMHVASQYVIYEKEYRTGLEPED